MSVTQINCPSNQFLCKKDIENIIYGNNNTTGVRNMNINKKGCAGDCNYLYEQIVSGKMTCKELYDELKNRSPVQVKMQIKYNFAQLLQMRLKLVANKIGPAFGTFDWWKRYIWGVNKIQNFIYFISFTIALIYVIYYTFQFLFNTKSLLWIGFSLIVAFILLVIIMYYSFLDQISYSIPVDKDPRYVQTNVDKYRKKVRENIDKETDSAVVTWLTYIKDIAIILALLGFSIYGTFEELTNKPILGADDKCEIKDPEGHKGHKQIGNLSFQYWIIWLILVIILGGKYLDLYDTSSFMTERKGWGLLMEPIFYMIKGIIDKVLVK